MRLKSDLPRVVAFGFSLAVFAPVSLATPTIQNAGFEAAGEPSQYGAIPNWTQVPNPSGLSGFTYLTGADTSGTAFYNNGVTPDPTHVAFIQVFGSGGGSSQVSTLSLQQTLSGFTPGQSYQITYYESARAGLQNPLLQVNLDGTPIVAQHVDTPVEAVNSHTVPFRRVVSGTFTPATATPTLAFVATQQASGNDATALIDGISVTAVPEPASLTSLSAAGAAAFLLARRRRQGKC